MKKLFLGKSKASNSPSSTNDNDVAANTLDRIIVAKQEVSRRWAETEQAHEERQRDHQLRMIDIEAQELERREKDLACKLAEMERLKEQHATLETRLQTEIDLLQNRLARCVKEHRADEESLSSVLAQMQLQVQQLVLSVEQRRQLVHTNHTNEEENEYEDIEPTAPTYLSDGHSSDYKSISSRCSPANSCHIDDDKNNNKNIVKN